MQDFGGVNNAQKKYGIFFCIICAIFAIVNLFNYLFIYKMVELSPLINSFILFIVSGFMIISSFKYNKGWKIFQVSALCVVSLLSVVLNIQAGTGEKLLNFPGDSLILVMVSIYISYIYQLLDKHRIIKIFSFMCMVFLAVLFPYVFWVPNFLITGICFVLFAGAVIYIYWVGDKVKKDHYEHKIKALEKENKRSRNLLYEVVEERAFLLQRYEKIVDENLYLKTACLDAYIRSEHHA
jgi:hypothetical protein